MHKNGTVFFLEKIKAARQKRDYKIILESDSTTAKGRKLGSNFRFRFASPRDQRRSAERENIVSNLLSIEWGA